MINEELLTEKLKYLVMSELHGKFEIIKFSIDIAYTDYEKKKNIESYDVDVDFDYMMTIDSEASGFGYDINKMSDSFRESLIKYQINEEGKIVVDSKYPVSDGMIWGVKFEADVKHFFSMSFRVDLAI